MTNATKTLNENAALFEKNGFLIKEELFSPSECEKMKAICKRECTEQGKGASGVQVWGASYLPDGTRDFVCDQRLANVLKDIAGPEVEFLSFKPVFKSANITYASPWHQDWSYWGGKPKISIWIALDTATIENGCLRVVPGSHIKEWKHDAPGEDAKFNNRIDESKIDQESVIDVELKQGSALFFHDLLLHASHPNTSGKDRWSLIPTYRKIGKEDKSAEYTNKTWKDPIKL